MHQRRRREQKHHTSFRQWLSWVQGLFSIHLRLIVTKLCTQVKLFLVWSVKHWECCFSFRKLSQTVIRKWFRFSCILNGIVLSEADDLHGFLPSIICEQQSCQIPQHYAGRLGEVLCLHRGANHAVHWGCRTSQTDTWSTSIQSANNGLLRSLSTQFPNGM